MAWELPKISGPLPPYAAKPFEFEASFDGQGAHTWFKQNWILISLSSVAIYLVVLFFLTRWMRDRKRYEVRDLFIAWNTGLALFSTFCSLRTVPEIVRIVLQDDGYHKSICDSSNILTPVNLLWTWWFAFSKIVELGDTIFIVLRRRPLTFLHVYHHCSVLLCTWYCVTHLASSSRWFITMNAVVHSVMYTYYAIQVARIIRVPKAISMTITILQILQMIIGVAVNFHGFNVKRQGGKCDLEDDIIYLMGALYFSYFLLFVWFFYDAYFRRNSNNNNNNSGKEKTA